MLPKKKVIIDMDGVIADTESHFIAWYFNKYGVRIFYKDIAGKPEGEGYPEKTAISDFVQTPGFFRTLPVMSGSVDAIRSLMRNYEIFIVSAAMEFPHSLSEKYDWLSEHFPFIDWRNIVFCGDKSIVHADFMIDDHSSNLAKFKGTPYLFHAAHNACVTGYPRVKSWKEVHDLLNG